MERLWDRDQTHTFQQLIQLLLQERQQRQAIEQKLQKTEQKLNNLQASFNTYLTLDIQQRTWEYQVFSELSQKLGTSFSYQDLFQSIFTTLPVLIPCDVVAVIFLNPTPGTPSDTATGQIFWFTEHHLSAKLRERLQQNLHASLVDLIAAPLSGEHLNSTQVLPPPSLSSDHHIDTLASEILIPLLADHTDTASIMGLLLIGREKLGQYSSEKIHLIYQVASYISILLEWFQSMLKTFEKGYLETIITQLPDGVLLLDHQGAIILNNPTARCYLELLSPEIDSHQTLKTLGNQSWQTLTAEAQEKELCLEMISPVSPDRIFEVVIKLISLDSQPNSWVILIRDISSQKQKELKIQNALEREQELNALKSQVIRTVSHEYRTPLTQITLVAETLNLHYPKLTPEQRSKFLQQIQSSAKQMSQLVDDMLVLNQVESGKLGFDATFLNCLQFCEQLIQENQFISRQKHRIHFIHKGESHAKFDPSLVRQILSNLLSNAIKYSPAGGTITVDLTVTQGYIILKVKDQGIGIPAEDQPQLFESFHRGRNVGTIQGTGLGLAIVKKAIDLHQGEIHFKSKVGAGSTFTVKLPCLS